MDPKQLTLSRGPLLPHVHNMVTVFQVDVSPQCQWGRTERAYAPCPSGDLS